MGIAIGIVLVAATIASFVMINAKVGRMAKRHSDPWTMDPRNAGPAEPDQGRHQGHPHGDHHGDGLGGGHHGGFSGGDGGGHHI
ncbi:MAG: hypothetical protein ACTHJW_15390 [Streptosporangiaceae bacterium]